MRLESSPNRAFCKGNVVARRDNLLVCCASFEGTADAEWQWSSFLCKDGVRAKRGEEFMWSSEAHFDLATGKLILRGKPLLQRGPNLLRGTRIVIETEADRAHIDNPRGRLEPGYPPKTAAPLDPKKELPSRCPLPEAPRDS